MARETPCTGSAELLRGARIEALQVTTSGASAPPDDEPLADGPVQPARRAPDLPSQIAAGIREMINDGVIAPGASLPQLQLAERFRVSRAPVREALKLLVAEAAVEHDPNRGFQVALLSSVEARQIYLIRRILESELLRTVRWPTRAELRILQDDLAILDCGLAVAARADWLRAHGRFHAFVFGLSPEHVIAREAMRLMRQTDRYRALAPSASWGAGFPATPEHHLVEALAKQDRDALLAGFLADRAEVERHLLASLEARGL
ncbi:GntR family transcriptional regulator [Paraburkholderia bannensis]|uniref:GntR family transcriptional regulator n=1 Tax=Paraburkholderia bannensis TaxID=765414 RepID=UPI002ABE7092|nr:GntR family transcriptional regulator [Paraburkholderia bannensis]